MYSAGVDFRVPLVSQGTFASTIASHTRSLVTQLAARTTPTMATATAAAAAARGKRDGVTSVDVSAEHDVAAMARTMTQYSARHLQSLDDLHAFLHALRNILHDGDAQGGSYNTTVDGGGSSSKSANDKQQQQYYSASVRLTATSLPRAVRAAFGARPRQQRQQQQQQEQHEHASVLPEATVAGWVCLLVCTQQMLLCVLHELSAVQGGLAWRAWYWSWAQQHSVRAAVHMTLASTRVCVSWLRNGPVRTLRALRTATHAHMHALQTLFCELVSCIGASYAILDTLNAAVMALQQQPCGGGGGGLVAAAADTGNAAAATLMTTVQHTHGAGDDDDAAVLPLAVIVRTATDTLAALLSQQQQQQQHTLSPHARNNDVSSSAATAAMLVPAVALSATHHSGAGDVVGTCDASSAPTPLHSSGNHRTSADGYNNTSNSNNDVATTAAATRALYGGVVALHECVQQCVAYIARLTHTVQCTHAPPPTRHVGRALMTATVLTPMAVWVARHNTAQLYATARRVAAVAVQLARNYVIDPLTQLKQSLLLSRPSAQAQRDAFDRDARALADIITDYYRDHSPRAGTLTSDELQAVRQHALSCRRSGAPDDDGYGLVLAQYRRHVQHPLLSALFGQLPRVLLIQLSHQALDISRVTNSIDDILASNDLNFRIMAMAPLLLASGVGVLWSLLRWRATQRPVRERLRRVWRALHRVVSAMPSLAVQATAPVAAAPCVTNAATLTAEQAASLLLQQQQQQQQPTSPQLQARAAVAATTPGLSMMSFDEAAASCTGNNNMCGGGGGGAGSYNAVVATATEATATAALSNYEQGVLLLLVHVLRATVVRHLRSYTFAHELLEDLDDLESARGTRGQRLLILQRMYMTHSVFR